MIDKNGYTDNFSGLNNALLPIFKLYFIAMK